MGEAVVTIEIEEDAEPEEPDVLTRRVRSIVSGEHELRGESGVRKRKARPVESVGDEDIVSPLLHVPGQTGDREGSGADRRRRPLDLVNSDLLLDLLPLTGAIELPVDREPNEFPESGKDLAARLIHVPQDGHTVDQALYNVGLDGERPHEPLERTLSDGLLCRIGVFVKVEPFVVF